MDQLVRFSKAPLPTLDPSTQKAELEFRLHSPIKNSRNFPCCATGYGVFYVRHHRRVGEKVVGEHIHVNSGANHTKEVPARVKIQWLRFAWLVIPRKNPVI